MSNDNGFSKAAPSGNVMIEMAEQDYEYAKLREEVDDDDIADAKYHAEKDDQ